MKRILILALALVLALGLAVPAMAFTSDSEAADDSVPYSLKIYLVEYDDNDLFGIVTLPESDRGYAKNEIVAAVVELDVPEDESPAADGYLNLVFGGVNVDLEVVDNDLTYGVPVLGTTATLTTADGTDLFVYDSVEDRLVRVAGANFADDETYKWMFFAKVEDDDAMLVAKLVDGTSSQEFDDADATPDQITITLEGVDYIIDRNANSYVITIDDTDSDYDGAVITIDIDDDNVSEGMSIDDGTYDFALGVNTKNELGIVKGAVIDTSGDDYDAIMDVYEDVVVDVFGMDYFLIGNYVRDSFFEKLSSADTVVAMVEIQPWTAYVTVPDNIVVDPPKTGDAASIMGFVMVALSGAGVVALRKRG